MATPDFSKIWGKNSPLAPYTFTDDHYLTGWNFVGSTPPARTMFDAWMRSADEKLLWLYENAFSENSLGGFLFWRLPNTAYFVGEKRALQDGPLDIYLECTVAGKTATTELKKLPAGPDVGNTLKDGNVTWIVRKFADAKQLDAHRTAAELDHPEKSVRKKHLAFEVYDKTETDNLLGEKISRSGDTITGRIWFANTDETKKSIFPSHYYHNVFADNNRRTFIHAYPEVQPPQYQTSYEIRIGAGEGRYKSFIFENDGLHTDLKGNADTASNAEKLGGQPLAWIVDQINAAKTGIVAGNLEQNGWVKFAGGLIVQWGSWGDSVQETSQWFTFPIAFPSRCFRVIVGTSISQEHIGLDIGYQVIELERTRAKIMTQYYSAYVPGVLGQGVKSTPEFIAIGI